MPTALCDDDNSYERSRSHTFFAKHMFFVKDVLVGFKLIINDGDGDVKLYPNALVCCWALRFMLLCSICSAFLMSF